MTTISMEKTIRHDHLLDEYYELLANLPETIALKDLFSIAEHCADFKPHREARRSESRVEAFAKKYGIWLTSKGEHYNTMTAYLHRSTLDEPRLTILGKIYAILFYIDDTMGNEFQEALSNNKKQEYAALIERLLSFLTTGELLENPSPIEQAMLEVLLDLKNIADPEWLERFLHFTWQHLKPAVQDQDSTAIGRILSVDEYIEMRNHISGMYPTILMMEVAADSYLPLEEIEAAKLLPDLRRLQFLCAALGGLINDFFSFEKEVLDANTDFNLISILRLHNPQLSLYEAIYQAAEIVEELTAEFFILSYNLHHHSAGYDFGYQVNRHISDLTDAIKATWIWQVETERYLRETSLFQEVRRDVVMQRAQAAKA